jgi:2,3-bisphosphoglycerate-dependent phosphoglycerate mutase
MNNTLIFLRHAKTIQDKTKPSSQWRLAETGKKTAKELATSGIFDDVDIVISSNEKKAYQTAKPFADRISKRIIKISELGELNRDKGGLLTQENYKRTMVKIFKKSDFEVYKWETSRHALRRFKHAIEKIDKQYHNKKILIVTHGIVMSLYFADIQNIRDNIFMRWESLAFCAWGIVKNGKVIKDVIEPLASITMIIDRLQ